MKFMNIMLLNDGDEVYRAVVKQENAVDASLIGTGNEQKYRITIEVDNPDINFDEVVLFSSGVLSARCLHSRFTMSLSSQQSILSRKTLITALL